MDEVEQYLAAFTTASIAVAVLIRVLTGMPFARALGAVIYASVFATVSMAVLAALLQMIGWGS